MADERYSLTPYSPPGDKTSFIINKELASPSPLFCCDYVLDCRSTCLRIKHFLARIN